MFRFNGDYAVVDGIETFTFPNIRSMIDFIGKMTQKILTLEEWTEHSWPIKLDIDDEYKMTYWFDVDRPNIRVEELPEDVQPNFILDDFRD